MTDAAGNVVERVRYDDWGRPAYINPATGAKSDRSQIGNPLAFTGREWDAATGLYYYRYRYYDPKLGRFINRDPIGIWGDLLNLGNGQTYTGGNPWSRVDPLGLESTLNRGFEGIGEAMSCRSKIACAAGSLTATSDAIYYYGDWGTQTAVLVASAFLPGPEDAVIAIAGTSRIGSIFVRSGGNRVLRSAGFTFPGKSTKIGQDVLNKWRDALRQQHGVKFDIGSRKAHRRLKEEGALGLFDPAENTIYLPKGDIDTHVFFEEVFHALQHARGLPRHINYGGREIDLWELEAKQDLFALKDVLGLTDDVIMELMEQICDVRNGTYGIK